MTPTQSIQAGLSKLTDFGGRADRIEYWWYSLFLVLVLALLVLGIVLTFGLRGARVSSTAWVILLAPLCLALAAAQVRRLRDAGLSPWWALANLIPFVGVPAVLVLTMLPSRQEGGETGLGSLSAFSVLMGTGWGAVTGAGALTAERPRAVSRRSLVLIVLFAAAAMALVYVGIQVRRAMRPPQTPAAVVAPSAPAVGTDLILLGEASDLRLYYDKSTARRVGPDMVSIQLVFDFSQIQDRNAVNFRSMKQNEVFNCAARRSSWATRFYMSEPLGNGAAVLIEDGQGSLLDMSDRETGSQRLDTLCGLLPGLEPAQPTSANGR